MNYFWWFITDFGDTSVTLPMAGVVFIFLVIRNRLCALVWLIATGNCAATIAALKILLRTCHVLLFSEAPFSPSGHMAMSTLVYGGVTLITARNCPLWGKAGLYLLTVLLLLGIGASRIALESHTIWEVAAGLMLGTGFTALFRRSLPHIPEQNTIPWQMLLICIDIIGLMHGTKWPIEASLRSFPLNELAFLNCR